MQDVFSDFVNLQLNLRYFTIKLLIMVSLSNDYDNKAAQFSLNLR